MKYLLLLLIFILGTSGCSTSLPAGTVSGHRFNSDYLGTTGIEVGREFRYAGEGTRQVSIHHDLAPVGRESVFTNRVFLFEKDQAGNPELAIVVTEMDDSGFLNPVESIDGARILSRGRLKDHWDFQYLTFVSSEGARGTEAGTSPSCRLTRWVSLIVQPLNRVRVSIVYSEPVPASAGPGPACSDWTPGEDLTAGQQASLAGFEQRAVDSYRVLD